MKHRFPSFFTTCLGLVATAAAGVSCWVFLFVVECPVLMWC